MRLIHPEPLTAQAFAPFGDVLAATGAFRLINAGLCRRHHDLAQLDFGADARPGISVFQAEPRALPYAFDLIERHPDGSQAFIPMSADPFLVIVADSPVAAPKAFLTTGAQGLNFHRGTWHGVLTPLSAPGLFAVIDRIGPTPNLEEHRYPEPWTVLPLSQSAQ
jgi:ureidoglycolate lyase